MLPTEAEAAAARLSGKLRFLCDDVVAYIAEMKRRSLYHAMGDSIKALEQSAGIASAVLNEPNPGQPMLGDLALLRDGLHDLENASSLLVRTVNDTLRHGLTKSTREDLEEATAGVARLLPRRAA